MGTKKNIKDLMEDWISDEMESAPDLRPTDRMYRKIKKREKIPFFSFSSPAFRWASAGMAAILIIVLFALRPHMFRPKLEDTLASKPLISTKAEKSEATVETETVPKAAEPSPLEDKKRDSLRPVHAEKPALKAAPRPAAADAAGKASLEKEKRITKEESLQEGMAVSRSRASKGQEPPRASFEYGGRTYTLFPHGYEKPPELPSPIITDSGREIITLVSKEGQYFLADVTLANEGNLDYASRKWAKGKQLEVNAEDFPTLARSGLHSEPELMSRRTITGIPIETINSTGRPENLSWAGFIAGDEDILSVLIGDNRVVAALGLNHKQTARTLFHIWNMILVHIEIKGHRRYIFEEFDHILYNNKRVRLRAEGTRGWQESIFNDEIQGMYQIEIWRDLSPEETEYLKRKYGRIGPQELSTLITKLSKIKTGEMVPYYIMRYGFYEGHTSYRADPIAIAFIFGLKSLEEIDNSLNGKLHEKLTNHYFQNPDQ
jgi:hypothetical protein